MRKSALLLPVLAVAIIGILSSLYIVDEREKALVLQFGQIKKVVDEPGLGVKIPIIQEVVRYDRRILSLDTDAIEVTPSDDRRLVVDAFTRYRIADVVQFRQAVGIGGTRVAEDRLASVLNAQIREVLGADQVTSDTILSPQRRDLAVRILEQTRASAAGLGLEIVDVRLKQTNLPQQNLDATFARMRAEREREAADEIARGNEAAQRVRAAADRIGKTDDVPAIIDRLPSEQPHHASQERLDAVLEEAPADERRTALDRALLSAIRARLDAGFGSGD